MDSGKIRTLLPVALALVAGLLFPRAAAQEPAASASFTLSLVGTNDLHGGILPRDGRGGLALLSGYVNNLRAARAKDGGAVLLVDGGDMFQGTLESNLSEGAVVVSAYNALGYAAVAVGNHEFDFGPVGPAATPQQPGDDPRGALKARASEAHFPFLAANLIDTATGATVSWPNVMPSTLVDVGTVKVGIVGALTSRALTATIATNVQDLRVAPLAAAIEAQAAALRARGATVVVLAAHVGASCTNFAVPTDLSSCDQGGEIFQVVRALPARSVDAVVGGHTHAGVGHQVQGIPISEAYSTGRAFGRIDLTIDRATKRVTASRSFAPRDLCARVDPGTTVCSPNGAPAQYEGAAVLSDPEIERLLEPAVASVAVLKASSLGVVLETPITRGNARDSALGNLFVDAFLSSAPGIDVALNNTAGGLRADLPAGPLTYGRLFEVFPFDNVLVRFHLTGAELRKLFAAQLQQRRGPVGVGGLRVRAQCVAGAPVISIVRTSGVPVRDDERLVVVTTDFVVTGGDAILTPVTPPQGFELFGDTPLGRDVVADALRRRGGSLRADELVNPANPRWSYPGALPLDCTRS
jgi:5'-nucleotidase